MLINEDYMMHYLQKQTWHCENRKKRNEAGTVVMNEVMTRSCTLIDNAYVTTRVSGKG